MCLAVSYSISYLLEATAEMGTEPSIRVMTGLGSRPDSFTCTGKGNMRHSKSVGYYNVRITSTPTTDFTHPLIPLAGDACFVSTP